MTLSLPWKQSMLFIFTESCFFRCFNSYILINFRNFPTRYYLEVSSSLNSFMPNDIYVCVLKSLYNFFKAFIKIFFLILIICAICSVYLPLTVLLSHSSRFVFEILSLTSTDNYMLCNLAYFNIYWIFALRE